MSESLVAKAGGTSNASAINVLQSMEWAEQADIFVVSAPGELENSGDKVDKVTDLLLKARKQYVDQGIVSSEIAEQITGRYAAIVEGLGELSLPVGWLDDIKPRFEQSVRYSDDAASMLGERLQAELYQAKGFTLLDPSRSQQDLGDDPEAWRGWLSSMFTKGNRYVLPGNTTKLGGQLVTFDRGGSDISGGLAAYGIEADKNLNLTDGSAMSADPRLIGSPRLQHIGHMLYEEGRELGRNGTGLLHPAAMVPLMIGNIPTEIRSTFDPTQLPTLLDNDYERASKRNGQVIALSLMRDVVIHQIHEPGMAEATGRLAAFEMSLAEQGIPIIDSQGDGVDGQKYFVDAKHNHAARMTLEDVIKHGKIDTKDGVDLITMVGFNLHLKLIDHMVDLIFNSSIDAKHWQTQRHDLSHGKHSLRVGVDQGSSSRIFDRLHAHFLELQP